MKTITQMLEASRLFQTLTLTAAVLFVGLVYQAIATDEDIKEINFQGRLVDSNGRPINGSKSLLFKVKENGTVIWEQSKTVDLVNGVFSCVLGDSTSPLTTRISGSGHVFSGSKDTVYAMSVVDGGTTYSDMAVKRVPSAMNSFLLNGKADSYFNPMSTAGDVIYGGTSGLPTRLAVGASNKVLKVSGGAPSWQDDTGFANPMSGTGQLIYGGTSGVATALAAGSNGQVLKVSGGNPSWATDEGKVVQVTTYTTGSYATTPNTIPADNSTPQIGEGAEFFTHSHTPLSSSNKLHILVNFQATVRHAFGSGGWEFCIALFSTVSTTTTYQTCAAGALGNNETEMVSLHHVMTADTTSAITFKVRGGTAVGGPPQANLDMNGVNGQRYNGTLATRITVIEYKP